MLGQVPEGEPLGILAAGFPGWMSFQGLESPVMGKQIIPSA